MDQFPSVQRSAPVIPVDGDVRHPPRLAVPRWVEDALPGECSIPPSCGALSSTVERPIMPMPDALRVRFRNAVAGWVRLRVERIAPDGKTQRLAMRAAEFYCPFGELIQWLEAMARGVRRASFYWEAENPIGRLSIDRDQLKIQWPARRGGGTIEMQCDRRQVIAAFYQALRRFATSAAYDPTEYEPMTLGEVIARRDGRGLTPDEMLGYAMSQDLAGLKRLLALAVMPELPPRKSVPDWWDHARPATRLTWLRARFAGPGNRNIGSPLRTLRSRAIERALDWRAPKDPPLDRRTLSSANSPSKGVTP